VLCTGPALVLARSRGTESASRDLEAAAPAEIVPGAAAEAPPAASAAPRPGFEEIL